MRGSEGGNGGGKGEGEGGLGWMGEERKEEAGWDGKGK